MEIVRPEFVPDASLSREGMERLQGEIADAAVFADDDALVAGVDQAFADGEAISAVVVLRGTEVVERAHAVEPVEIPYIPGLLSFREGTPILSALSALDTEPDVVLVDGNGRIHFREAGLATHVGVAVDVPTVGVAKNLLCGRPREPLSDPLPEGTRVAIEADDEMTTPEGTVVGYAVQTRRIVLRI
jgi:deoxyribonuclease V